MKNINCLFLFIALIFHGSLISQKDAGKIDTTKNKEKVNNPVADRFTLNAAFFHSDGEPVCDSISPDCMVKLRLNKSAFMFAQSHKDSLRLWLNHVCFTSLLPLHVTSDSSVIFRMVYDTSRISPWRLYYSYRTYLRFWDHQVKIAAGTVKREFNNISDNQSTLVTTQAWQVWLAYSLFVAVLILIFLFGKGILKDTAYYRGLGINVSTKSVSNPETSTLNIKDIPYSLARTQFFFWLMIIYLSILHIWAFLDALAVPTGTVLFLLGISGSTFYIGSLIDQPVSNPQAPPTPAAQIIQQLKATRRRLLPDILNDGQSVSVHRLQLVLFTIFLGIYFLWYVLYNLSLPQFDNTLLLLMGISGTTYAGMKTLEK